MRSDQAPAASRRHSAMFRTSLPKRMVAALPLLALALIVGNPAAARAQVEPNYWRQRVFFIPYQPNAQDPQVDKIDKVQLLVSRDGGQQWAVLQEADPHVRGFSYHAAADGEYAFALRMSDRRGRLWPEQIAQPLLRVVVDTQVPTLQLAATLDAMGQVLVKYEARDQKIKTQSLRLEVQGDNGTWQRLSAGPPELNQPDRLLGQVAWRPPTSGAGVKFRATIEDAAGNQGTAVAEASLVGSMPGPTLAPAAGPQLAPPGGGAAAPAIDSQASQPADLPRAALEWPTNNTFASERRHTPSASSADSGGSFTSGAGAGNAGSAPPSPTPTPGGAQLGADVAAPSLLPSGGEPASSAAANGTWETLRPVTPPAQTVMAPAAVSVTPIGQPSVSPIIPPSAPPSGSSVANGTPWVNSLTFDLDYDIQTVGPWGVAKVELWGTRDGGRQWQSLGVDQDNRSPMRVTVPTAGVYGFRIVVDGGNGVAAPTPNAGEQPELVVGVDMTPPRTELRATELGQGPFAGHLIIRWSAADENLAAHPVGLFFSAAAEGPWSTIATDLDNTGDYSWRLGRDAPPRVFVRIEVRDVAGNVEVRQSPTAVDLNLPRPTGRLRNVRPVEGDPSRYRTASGARPAEG